MPKSRFRTFETLLTGREVWQEAVRALGARAVLSLVIQEKPNPTRPEFEFDDRWLEAFSRFGDVSTLSQTMQTATEPEREPATAEPVTVDFWIESLLNPSQADEVRNLRVTSHDYEGTLSIMSDEAKALLTMFALSDSEIAGGLIRDEAA
jgi:hypothetical protein